MRPRFVCLLFLSIAGCSQATPVAHNIYVKPNGYTGEALINCSGTTDKDVTVELDEDGVATAPCPSETSHVRVEEAGKWSKPSDVMWTKSTEGDLDSVSIAIQHQPPHDPLLRGY